MLEKSFLQPAGREWMSRVIFKYAGPVLRILPSAPLRLAVLPNRPAELPPFFDRRLMEWHTRWSDEGRTLYHVTCYR